MEEEATAAAMVAAGGGVPGDKRLRTYVHGPAGEGHRVELAADAPGSLEDLDGGLVILAGDFIGAGQAG